MEESDFMAQLEALTIQHQNSGYEPSGMQVDETIDVNENDDIKLLPGYRFHPFDYELIVHYLWKKVNKEPLPHNKILELKQLYKYNPEEFTKTDQGLVENEWYFFMARDGECGNGDGDGYWKGFIEDEKTVYYKGVVVGRRKELVFYRGKAPEGDETNWIMHEFTVTACPSTYTCQDDTRLDDWVLCRIYRKDDKYKKVPKKIHNENSASKDGGYGNYHHSYSPVPTEVYTLQPPSHISFDKYLDELGVDEEFFSWYP